MATNSKPITPERREYKRAWMRTFRAKAKAASAPKNALVPKQKLTQSERIATLERELAQLKADAGLTLNIGWEPTPEELHEERITQFRTKLYASPASDSIAIHWAEARALEAEFDSIIHAGPEPFDKAELLKGLAQRRDKARELEARAEYLERMIVLWSPGGQLRRERELQIEQDRTRGTLQRNSQNPYEQRKGIALLNGCDKNEGELEVTLGRLKAELKQLRE